MEASDRFWPSSGTLWHVYCVMKNVSIAPNWLQGNVLPPNHPDREYLNAHLSPGSLIHRPVSHRSHIDEHPGQKSQQSSPLSTFAAIPDSNSHRIAVDYISIGIQLISIRWLVLSGNIIFKPGVRMSKLKRFSTSLAICEGKPSVTCSKFPSQRVSNTEFWCFLCC